MKFTYRNILSSIVMSLLVTMLFSCEGNLEKVRAFSLPEDAPQAIGKGLKLVYTDSGRVVATLEGAEMMDYSNKDFPYRQFPKGVEVEFFDSNNGKSTIKADYAMYYTATGLVDLQGNVEIITSDSIKLYAKQLYWDQNLEWVFTDHANTIKFKNGAVNEGMGFDSNQEFSNFRSRSNVGVQIIEEKEK